MEGGRRRAPSVPSWFGNKLLIYADVRLYIPMTPNNAAGHERFGHMTHVYYKYVHPPSSLVRLYHIPWVPGHLAPALPMSFLRRKLWYGNARME